MIDINHNAPCPCGSTKRGADCCVRLLPFKETNPDGDVVSEGPRWLFQTPQADPRPTKPRTGFAHPKCYAAPLNDCSPDIEGEHYFSAGMLELFGGESGLLNVDGLPGGKTQRPIHWKSLVGNFLCARHNRTLSPIDAAAIRAFEFIRSFRERLAAGASRVVGVNGHDIERWLLKALCGVLRVRKRDVPELWIRMLFRQCDFIQPRGLYVYAIEGQMLSGETLGLSIAEADDGAVVGASFQLLNHEFVLAMAEKVPARNEHVGRVRMYRPGGFRISHDSNGAAATLLFAWQGTAAHGGVYAEWSP